MSNTAALHARIPVELDKALRKAAKRESVPMVQILVEALSDRLGVEGGRTTPERVAALEAAAGKLRTHVDAIIAELNGNGHVINAAVGRALAVLTQEDPEVMRQLIASLSRVPADG